MSPQHQKEIVTDLCNRIRDRVLQKIDEHDIPENWDGLELRQLLAEAFWRERTIGPQLPINHSSKRAKDYHMDVRLNDLDR